jgi:superfamily I DNA/RNA helicase
LQDVDVLIDIFSKLQQIRINNTRQTSLEFLLDIVSLGNLVEKQVAAREDKVFFNCGSRRLTSAYSVIRSRYAENFKLDEHKLQEQIRTSRTQFTPDISNYKNEEDLWLRFREMALSLNRYQIDEAIARFLGLMSLNNAQDQLQDINAVSLLTFHAAKGLEFDKVILMGMENENMPSFRALRVDADDDRPVSQKMEEQRRLFYVGLTRAKTEVILTAVKNRGGWERNSSPFLREIKNGLGKNSNPDDEKNSDYPEVSY